MPGADTLVTRRGDGDRATHGTSDRAARACGGLVAAVSADAELRKDSPNIFHWRHDCFEAVRRGRGTQYMYSIDAWPHRFQRWAAALRSRNRAMPIFGSCPVLDLARPFRRSTRRGPEPPDLAAGTSSLAPALCTSCTDLIHLTRQSPFQQHRSFLSKLRNIDRDGTLVNMIYSDLQVGSKVAWE